MKKMVRIVISAVLVCVMICVAAVSVSADTIFTDNGFSFTQLDGNYVSVCDWEGGSDTMSIPEKLNGYNVREIAGWSFAERDDFSGVDFSHADYLKVIGTMAFSSCTGITTALNIPAQVTTIGSGAFQECSSVDTLYYNTAANIPDQCFYLCSSLHTVYLSYGVSSIGRFAFASCNDLEFILIPETVETIDATAFSQSPNVVIYCYRNSCAHEFAEENGIDYVLYDPPQTVTYVVGDADGDGEVTILDSTKIQRVLAELDTDADGMITLRGHTYGDDPELNIMDATGIQRFLADFVVDIPFGEEVTVEI